MHNKLQYTWRGDYCQCVRPAQLSVLTAVGAPSFLKQHPWCVPHRDRVGYNLVSDARLKREERAPTRRRARESSSTWEAIRVRERANNVYEIHSNNIHQLYNRVGIKRFIYIYKGKSVPLQAWTGPEGSRKLRLPDYVTTAQDGGKIVSQTHRPPLPPGNTPGTHFC